jgi:[glutamine synthetase] adenylyltransferase / [glutamine synthetase]-adenylyl-L-tyrosine phosphorylase
LTDLAETTLCAVVGRCETDLRSMYGSPMVEDGQACGFSLLALGKCGGRELGFASDIELMFVYAGNGQTTGVKAISNAEYFEQLVRSVVSAMQSRQEGIFQIDLQLRPHGKAGSMAVSLDSFRRYYAPDGAAWAYERQALVKLRPITGDARLNEELCRLRDVYAYESGPFDVTSMRAMRERQVRHLVTGGTFNAKFSPGGLVDIEYLIQGLQINHGAQNPALRLTNLRDAMSALHDAGILVDDDFIRLRKAHTFLRWLIDSLRVVRGNAKDVTIPPFGTEEFIFLARRLRYEMDVVHLRDDLARYIADVQEINNRLLGRETPA